MLQPLESYSGRVEAMKESQRSRIPQVIIYPKKEIIKNIKKKKKKNKVMICFIHKVLDCPEREAIYVITNGGINDPDKV